MDIFLLTLEQLLMMTTLMVVGYFLRKKNIVPDNTGIALSKLETFVLAPSLSITNMLKNCNIENFMKNYKLMLYGLAIVTVAIAIAYLISRFFIKNTAGNPELEYRRNIYKYALTFSNYAFVGNFVILGVWGEGMLYKYLMFTFLMGIICGSWGLYVLIPKGQGSISQNLKKGLTAPPIFAMVFGIVCGILDLKQYFPSFLLIALDNASKCMGPVAMLLAGVVIGGYNIKGLLADKKVYIVSLLRLIALPTLFLTILNLLGTDKEIMILALIAFASPLGLNTIVYPAAYGGETKTGASMTVVSQTLSVITIPVMYYIFIVLL